MMNAAKRHKLLGFVSPPRQMARSGFTLAEVVVATVIAVFIAGATASSLSQMIRMRGASASHQEAYARAEGVASRIALDLQCAVRDQNLSFSRISITNVAGAGGERDELLVLMRSLRPLREATVEGDEYEAQYRIEPASIPTATGDRIGEAFWRRVDAAHDDYQDAGGVATPIAMGAVSLSIQANNGETWFDSWESDTEGMPHAVRVSVTARSDDGKTVTTVRRVVAIDRVPLAPSNASTASEKTDSAGGASGTGASGTGTSGTGTSGGGGAPR